jgi:cytidine deaminase
MAKTNNITFTYKEIDSSDELNKEDRDLLIAAGEVAINAYAPYSRFKVGAALRLESGKIITGTNVENAAFPSGICAERNAISNAASNYPGDRPVTLAIAAYTEKGLTDEPVPPCGNCRQVIAEEEFRHSVNIKIILGGKNKIVIIDKGGDLLPLQFNRNNLKTYLH